MEKVDKQFERVGTEKIERLDLESLKRNLDTLNRRIHELPNEAVTQEMEPLMNPILILNDETLPSASLRLTT